ncbi:hypothetical protein CEXT_351711 [Caerostris extrusa]|uniref:Uncharacterized protein n=1 Tax=Caerostris extrusa TaxID=172846 RepID=A0AAV4V8Q7_CAEEX|nr:hypothetical protein CEXT_351711 [Caerostris extrusa]
MQPALIPKSTRPENAGNPIAAGIIFDNESRSWLWMQRLHVNHRVSRVHKTLYDANVHPPRRNISFDQINEHQLFFSLPFPKYMFLAN